MKTLAQRVKDAERRLAKMKERQKLEKMKVELKRQKARVKAGTISSTAREKKDTKPKGKSKGKNTATLFSFGAPN